MIKLVLEYCLEIKIIGCLVPGEYRFLLIDSKILHCFEFSLTCSNQNGNASLVAFHSVKSREFLSSYDIIASNHFQKRCNNLLSISFIGQDCKPAGDSHMKGIGVLVGNFEMNP